MGTQLTKFSRSILYIFCIIILISGCTKSNQAPEKTQTSTSQTQEQKWDVDEISKTIKLNGKSIFLPCTLEDLGEEFSYGIMLPYLEKEGFDNLHGQLLYHGKEVANVSIFDPLGSKKESKYLIY